MNAQRILRRLVQAALMVGTVALLPIVQAKSVPVVGVLTATAQRDVDGLPRGASGRLTPDARPLLVAPSCSNGNCRPTRDIGQAQPSIQGNESFDATPVLVAPDCGSVTCNPFRFFG